jgi:predicted amidophosphoribosyltransferase
MDEIKRVGMRDEQGVTMDFTIESADPSAKLDPDGFCAVCEQKVSEHTAEMLNTCAEKLRDQMQGSPDSRRFPPDMT